MTAAAEARALLHAEAEAADPLPRAALASNEITCPCGAVLRVAGRAQWEVRSLAREFYWAHRRCGRAASLEAGQGGTGLRDAGAPRPFGADPRQAAPPAAQAGAADGLSEAEIEIAHGYAGASR